VPRDPFANFERMRRDIDELFGAFERSSATHRRGFSPRVDVFYEGDPPRAVVAAELPGVHIDEVRLEIRGRKLLIAGMRRARASEGRVYQQIEIEHGPFRRVVELGADVATDEASATFDNGILTVEVPLAPRESQVRRVPIGSARGEGEGGLDAEAASSPVAGRPAGPSGEETP
jgi:HSP20 family protein